ncbi:hypothetical protein U9M48_038173 [Paspalum notatum var. saurae]|uniref:Uncharacterized protein n=1 Tax=Paspalum notatum var. saurae TaxID=547442 RepID=A0AAQ3XBD9_PASNO
MPLVVPGCLSASTAVLPFGCPAPAPWLPLHFRLPASLRPLPGSGRPPPCVRSPAPLASPRPAHRNYTLLKVHRQRLSNAAGEWKSDAFTPFGFHGRDPMVETSVRCYCLQPLMDSESMISPSLMLISDEALLTISMVFAYLAGVVPSGQTSTRIRNRLGVSQQAKEPSSSGSGRDSKFLPGRNTGFDPSSMWSEVRAKLSEALQAHVQDAGLDREDELTSDRKNYPLSMLAIHAGPRLRLLLITFQLLEMEARGTL